MVGRASGYAWADWPKPIKNGRAYLASRAGPEGALTNATERRRAKASQQHKAAFDCPGGDMTTIVHDDSPWSTGDEQPKL